MWWKRIATVSLAAGLFVSVVAFGVAAAEDHLIYEDGTYVLVIPGVGDFEFEVDYVNPAGDEMVIAVEARPVIAVAARPEGYYYVDDDDPAKAAWKDAASLEVEMKLDKIESKVTWGSGVAMLTLPGGSITVTQPDDAGDFIVTASGIWTEFGSGGDWMVADASEIDDAERFFKVEATADGIELKAVSRPPPDNGFLNDLEEEYEEEEEEAVEVEFEDDDSDGAGHGKDKNEGKGKNK